MLKIVQSLRQFDLNLLIIQRLCSIYNINTRTIYIHSSLNYRESTIVKKLYINAQLIIEFCKAEYLKNLERNVSQLVRKEIDRLQ